MKYALISEEQIKAIEDALTAASYVPRGVMYPAGYHMQIAQALATMSALKPQEPVAWIAKGGNGALWWHQSIDEHGNNNPKDVPLFALEQT